MNLGFILAAASSLAALSMIMLWQIEKNTSITLEGKLQVLSVKFEQQQSENLKLENSLYESINTSKKNIALIEKNSRRMIEYGDKLRLAEKENNQLTVQINELRTAEVGNAIKEPYQRGHAAADRWANIMQRIARATSTNRQRVNRANTATTDLTTNPSTAHTD